MHPTGRMPAITHLMKRLGFVKLDRYGLVLTPEGRIMSLRPTVLDDGLGGKVVGWQEGDLAAMELDQWEPFRPASQRAVASRVAITMLPAPAPAPAPVPVPAALTAPAPVSVAPEPVVEEDEWEWEIAIARARVAADEVQRTVAALTPRRTKPTPPPLPPAPRTLPMPVVTITAEPMTSGTWPKTEPLGTIDYEDYTSPLAEVVRVPMIVEPTPKPAPVAKSVRPGTSPVTVIPVPRLPSLRDGGSVTPIELRAMPPRRYPKGTGPVDPNHLADRTKPGIALPSIKQRTASRG